MAILLALSIRPGSPRHNIKPGQTYSKWNQTCSKYVDIVDAFNLNE
jgi:hypothetical protein